MYIGAIVIILVPLYFLADPSEARYHGIFIGSMVLYWFHSIYICDMVFILVPCYLYCCHGKYISTMIFILVP